MSEAKTSNGSKTKGDSAPKAESKSKSESAPKAESKSDSAAPKAAPKAKDGADGAAAASSDAKSSDGGKDGAKEGGKSARESIGGKADAHYGYFSSVRTPAYRSGWDAIWGSRNGEDDADGTEAEETPRRRAHRPAAKTRKRRDPITVTLDLDGLPPDLRDGLVEIARAELKKSRVSYARRDKAGAIDWRITCRVD